jgi:serine/threonine protein kinase
LRPLGEGGQSWTYLARRSNGSDQDQYVLKRLKNKERLTRFEREIDALKKLSHPGIIRIEETADLGESPFYVAEYCEKGDLSKSDLSGKPLLDNLRLFRQVCDALAVVHEAGIIHRDLKPPNILIRRDDSIAVGDFGLCLDLSDIEERATLSSEPVGARHYIAPELEGGRAIDPKPSSDVYSLGKLLYYILSGGSLPRERHTELTYDLRKSDSAPELYFVYDDLFNKTIVPEPHKRYTNARGLLNYVDVVIDKIEKGAHVLNLKVGQPCLYCVVGMYEEHAETAVNVVQLRCTYCGNVQTFRKNAGWQWWKGTDPA